MSERTTQIIALLTVYNRKAKTLACLESLEAQELPVGHDLGVVLVDDGSSDGTAEAVRSRFPRVEVVRGSGQLFWNGGMRVAIARAQERDPAYMLWMNDDTTLEPSAVRTLVATAEAVGPENPALIVVGSTLDPAEGTTSYGGRKRPRSKPTRFELIEPAAHPQRCETFNGNCVLVSRAAVARVGNLDPGFTHAIGDFDYGLRATASGCACWIAPGHLGRCAPNAGRGTFQDPTLSPLVRWRHMLGPKGLPAREWRVFTRRHCGSAWPVYWAGAYANFWLRALRDARRIRASRAERAS